MDRDHRSFSVRALNIQAVPVAEVQFQALRHVGDPETAVVCRGLLLSVRQCLQVLQFLRFHSDPVVRDPDKRILAVSLRRYADLAHPAPVLDPMIECIFHKGLKSHLDDGNLLHVFRKLDPVGEDIPVPELLYLQVRLHMGDLLAEGNDVPSAGQRRAEELGQGHDDGHDVLLAVCLCQPDDVVQRVVQEMRIDLGLQQLQLHVPVVDLFRADVFDQHGDLLRHAVEAVPEKRELIFRRNMDSRFKMTLADLLCRVAQDPDRAGNASGDQHRKKADDHNDHQKKDHGSADQGSSWRRPWPAAPVPC